MLVDALSPSLPPLLVTVAQSAHALACSRRTIERLIALGRLDTTLLGTRRMVRYASLARLARNGAATIAPRRRDAAAVAEVRP